MKKQKGLSLVEVMVGMLLVGIAVTGLVGQSALLADNSNTLMKSDAKARFAGRIMSEVRRAFATQPTGSRLVSAGVWNPSASGLLASVSLVEGDLLADPLTDSVYRHESASPVHLYGSLITSATSATYSVRTARGWLPSAVSIDLKVDSAPAWLSSSDYATWSGQLSGVSTATLNVDQLVPADSARRQITIILDDVVLTQTMNVPGL